MTAVLRWARQNVAAYLDNATSTRDYRAQFRGSRAAFLWGAYLLLLIGIAMLFYSQTADRGTVSVVEAQSSLQDFYRTIVMLLATAIVLISPALSAATVVAERERRSLDLVFCAPIKPKTFLIGKVVSAYRYTWMLLVLSLPVTSVCVVLGGATWADVLVTYLLLSLNALLISAIALLLSTLAPKMVSAVLWSYAAVGVYLFVLSGFGFAVMFSSIGEREAPFISAMNPFLVAYLADTVTKVGSWEVPNWILVLLFTLLMVRLILLGAASALSPYGAPETKNLRISGLAYTFGLALLLAWTLAAPSLRGASAANLWHGVLAWVPQVFILFMPFLCCYGRDAERKYHHDGVFSFAAAIRGTPAGALPYLLMTLTALAGGVALGVYLSSGTWDSAAYWSLVLWVAGFWTFMWGLGRLASSMTTELRSARVLHLAWIMLILGLPVPFLSLLDTSQMTYLWYLYPLYPLWSSEPDAQEMRLLVGAALAALGLYMAWKGERRYQARAATLETST